MQCVINWDIILGLNLQYYEEIGKPSPEGEVMKFLKSSMQYRDAKEFSGECESVVMIAKGQSE